MTPLEQLQHHYRQREQLAREWSENGGKVAGYIGVDVPEELLTIHSIPGGYDR